MAGGWCSPGLPPPEALRAGRGCGLVPCTGPQLPTEFSVTTLVWAIQMRSSPVPPLPSLSLRDRWRTTAPPTLVLQGSEAPTESREAHRATLEDRSVSPAGPFPPTRPPSCPGHLWKWPPLDSTAAQTGVRREGPQLPRAGKDTPRAERADLASRPRDRREGTRGFLPRALKSAPLSHFVRGNREQARPTSSIRLHLPRGNASEFCQHALSPTSFLTRPTLASCVQLLIPQRGL